MARWEPTTTASVVGLACFGILNLWNEHAPKLGDVRNAPPGDLSCKQNLIDTEFYIGGISALVGTAFAILSRDVTPLILMMVVIGGTIWWYHQVLAAPAVE